jgi:hypothetical protein
MHARSLLLALLCYGALSAFFYRDLVRAPGSVLPEHVGLTAREGPLHWGDEQMVAATIGIVARRLFTAPTRIHDLGQCWPFPDSLTLGEPMFVDGLVGAVPFALTHNPIVAKNFVTVTAPVIAGLCMFALILYWTGSTGAALVAGLLFGFEPARLSDVAHPFIHGNAWTPLVFLCTHRLFARRRWLDAALLAIALSLQMLESFYPALALALVGSVYGTALAVHHRRELPALLPKLAAVALFLALVARLALGPYLETRDVWGVLQGRGSFLHLPKEFYYGSVHYLGTVLLALAVVALLDRVRRGAGLVFDPRLPLLVGGAFVYWFVVWGIAIPLVGTVPSPYLLGLRHLPGINAVRVVTAVRSALPFVGACLAGFGVAVLLRLCGQRAGRVVATLVFVLAAGEVFTLSRAGQLRLRATPAKPDAGLLRLLNELPPGPVLDYPPSGYVGPSTHYVLLHGFHGRGTDACHSSFPNPMAEDVAAMSSRLPSARAALQLRTLGFRSIVVHTELLEPEMVERFVHWADGDGREFAGLRRLGEEDGHIAYVLEPGPPTVGFEALALRDVAPDRDAQVLDAADEAVAFTVRNMAPAFYRHPEPIQPDPVVLGWLVGERVVQSEDLRVLLPLALIPNQKQVVRVRPTVLPPPGDYTAVLRRRDAEGPIVSRRRVEIPAVTSPRLTGDGDAVN